MAMPALARPPFRLGKDPQPLLSPPILDEAGTTCKLDDFIGRVVLLNIWATWCCRVAFKGEMTSSTKSMGVLCH